MMAAQTLMDDLVEEILLRFPPEDPASLVRASLVCEGWRRLILNSGFGRRFREFHRTPPMLGFLCNLGGCDEAEDDDNNDDVGGTSNAFVSCFVPTSSSYPLRGRFVPKSPRPQGARCNGWRALDSRHGRVLLHTLAWMTITQNMIVWNPITDEQVELPKLPEPSPYHITDWNAAVLCAAGGDCDHLDCHRGPFLVLFIGCAMREGRFTRVFSSEAGAWSEPAYTSPGYGALRVLEPGVLVMNTLYFRCYNSTILVYDLTSRGISEILLPDTVNSEEIVLITTEDDGLGFASIVEDSKLCLWSKVADPEDDAGWAQSRVIGLKALLPASALSTSPQVLGFAEGVGAIVLWTDDGFFTINLRSYQVMEVEDDEEEGGSIYNVVPYVSFYTPLLKYNVLN